jgi:hypothetical protein
MTFVMLESMRAQAENAMRKPPSSPVRARVSAALSRRWNDLPLHTKGIAVIGIPLLPVFLSALVFGIAARRMRAANDWVSHTLEVKVQIATVLNLPAALFHEFVDAVKLLGGFWAAVNETPPDSALRR